MGTREKKWTDNALDDILTQMEDYVHRYGGGKILESSKMQRYADVNFIAGFLNREGFTKRQQERYYAEAEREEERKGTWGTRRSMEAYEIGEEEL